MVPITSLKTNLFVRKSLNYDHANMLKKLMVAGKKLPAIQINPDFVVIDGRHRIAAHEMLGLKEIEVEVIAVTDEIDMSSMAFKANDGGALPPSDADKEHTVELLIDRKESHHNIAKLLGLPLDLVRHYIKSIKSKSSARKLAAAAADVTTGGLTMTKAAEAHNVDIDKLRTKLGGGIHCHEGLDGLKARISSSHRSIAARDAAVCRGVIEKYEDGIMTAKQAERIFDYLGRLHESATASLADWRKRFETVAKTKR
jgi:hypothetical protein